MKYAGTFFNLEDILEDTEEAREKLVNGLNAQSSGLVEVVSRIPEVEFKTVTVRMPSSIPAWRDVGSTGNPAFQNSWGHFGSPWGRPAFRISPTGWVDLKGLFGRPGGALALPSTLFTLPVGYRPAENFICDVGMNDFSAEKAGQIRIYAATGVVECYSVTPTPYGGSMQWVVIDGLGFQAGSPAAPDAFRA